MDQIRQSLQKYYGYSTFRPLQEEIIADVLEKKDTFVLMPTGGGKSLCYQLPSLHLPGTTIVVSPLISLMKDQVDSLVQNGIAAAFLNSTLSLTVQEEILQKAKQNELRMLYVAPERLTQKIFLSFLLSIPLNFFAIDEAHCISQWGHDFRPEYRKLSLLKEFFPKTPIIALTATATPRVRDDILSQLHFPKSAKTYQASFNRSNLSYAVLPKQKAFDQLLTYISAHPNDSGIVYCLSRKTVEQVAKKLQAEGISALPYHAGLPDKKRSKNQELFIKDEVSIIVATIAFGMGIDKSNVRFVIHYDMPKSLEGYYQETGRAGRDGLSSECLFLYRESDKFTLMRFIDQMESQTEKETAQQQLLAVSEYAQSSLCRRYQLLEYFGEIYGEHNCHFCDNCTTVRETFDGTMISQKILSCVFRVSERFGAKYVSDVLRGVVNKKITEHGHDTLSTYGIVNEYSSIALTGFMHELVTQGLLYKSPDQYGVLSLTEKGRLFLKNKETIQLIVPDLTIPEPPVRAKKEQEVVSYDRELFELLRSLRKELAGRVNLPPYIIFSDVSLQQMATFFPQTKEQFGNIYGVGDEKLKKYSDIFLTLICEYCLEKHIDPIVTEKTRPLIIKKTKKKTKKKYRWHFRKRYY